jgi:hypothetical protein
MSTHHYFAQDGGYGTATNLRILDTSEWTSKDWEKIENATDAERVIVALQTAQKRLKK